MEKAQTGIQKTWVWGLGYITREVYDYGYLSSLTCPRKITWSVEWSQKSLSALGLHDMDGFGIKNLSFPPSSIHHTLIPPTPNLLMIKALEGYLWCPICWHTARERNVLATCAHVYFILDAFQRSRVWEEGEGGRGPPCRISYRYYCPTPYVGTGPKHSRQSGCGKAWAFYQLASSKGQIRDLEF